MNIKWFVFINLILFYSNAVFSNTFYISPEGSDYNNGSYDDPFKSLQNSIDNLQPGDELVLFDGDYPVSRTIKISSSGLPNSPIVIRALNKGKAHVFTDENFRDGSVFVIGKYDRKWLRNIKMYLVIDGLDIYGGKRYGIQSAGGGYLSVINCLIHDTGNDAIKINHSAHNVLIMNNEIFNTGHLDKCHVKMRGCNSDGIDITSSDNVVVKNNYLHNILSWGIYTKKGSSNTLIESNLLKDIGESGIGLGESSVTYNAIARNNIIINASESCLQASGAKNSGFYNNSCINVAINNGKNWAAMRVAPAENKHGARKNDSVYSENVTFKNNLLVVHSDSSCMKVTTSSLEGESYSSLSEVNFSNNICLRDMDSDALYIFRGDKYKSLNEWRSYSSSSKNPQSISSEVHISHDIIISSLNNYKEKYASFISYKGVADILAGENDFNGNLRIINNKNNIDIGAVVVNYELQK